MSLPCQPERGRTLSLTLTLFSLPSELHFTPFFPLLVLGSSYFLLVFIDCQRVLPPWKFSPSLPSSSLLHLRSEDPLKNPIMDGASVLAQALKDQGVNFVFGSSPCDHSELASCIYVQDLHDILGCIPQIVLN